MSNPVEAIKLIEYAAEEFFRLLLSDWQRLGYFRDHRLCDPKVSSEAARKNRQLAEMTSPVEKIEG